MIDVIHYIVKQTRFSKGKVQKTMSIIDVLKDKADDSTEQHLTNPKGQGPQLRIFVKGSTFDFAAIVCDGTHIEPQAADSVNAILLLLATYYVFDVQYPRPYSQILGFLQQYVLDDLYTGLKCANFLHFVSRLAA